MRRQTFDSTGMCGFALLIATMGLADEAKPPVEAGRRIKNLDLQDYRGKSWSLVDFKDHKGLVVIFLGVECPIAGQYASRLQELAAKYEPSGIGFVAIDSNQQDSLRSSPTSPE